MNSQIAYVNFGLSLLRSCPNAEPYTFEKQSRLVQISASGKITTITTMAEAVQTFGKKKVLRFSVDHV
jgi:hypothetical protein